MEICREKKTTKSEPHINRSHQKNKKIDPKNKFKKKITIFSIAQVHYMLVTVIVEAHSLTTVGT